MSERAGTRTTERAKGASQEVGGGRPVVRIRRLPSASGLPVPDRATPGSAGFDLRSAEDDFTLAPGERRLVPTGFAIEMPVGIECQIRPRSGLALRHGLTVLNSPGTVDPDYRGELRVILVNLGTEPVRVEAGERIAQAIFSRFEAPVIEEVEDLSSSGRGSGGFGSTGRG